MSGAVLNLLGVCAAILCLAASSWLVIDFLLALVGWGEEDDDEEDGEDREPEPVDHPPRRRGAPVRNYGKVSR